MIFVTKTYLPKREAYIEKINQIWDSHILTNRGSMVLKLETKISDYLESSTPLFVSNGTIALQIAIKALSLSGEIITTPFSYVATSSSIFWEGCKPIFADICKSSLCINPEKIEALITKNTSAILATHVFGIPCDVEKIEAIAQKHNLKIIYDAAHSFGVKLNGKSIFDYGDISTCSFHATKLFHTGEGGAIFCKEDELMKKIKLLHSFGHIVDDYYTVGINGKNSELHAAMGLCVLADMDLILEKRKIVASLYNSLLNLEKLKKPTINENVQYNYAYYPIILESEAIMTKVRNALIKNDIMPRRYFYPSLNTLSFYNTNFQCPVSESISSRILCLPYYPDLEPENINRIANIVNQNL